MSLPSTDWNRYGLADISDALKEEDPVASGHRDKGWRIMKGVCAHMAERLTTGADELARAWPPEHSPAAAEVQKRTRKLAALFTEASEAAGENSVGLNMVLDSMARSKGLIGDLCHEWADMEQVESRRAWITRTATLPVSVLGSVALATLTDEQVVAFSYQPVVRQIVDRLGAPQVRPGWRADLDSQARTIMAANDQAIVDAIPHFVQTPVVEPEFHGGSEGWPPRRAASARSVNRSGADSHTTTSTPPVGTPGRSPFQPVSASTHPATDGHAGTGHTGPVLDRANPTAPDGTGHNGYIPGGGWDTTPTNPNTTTPARTGVFPGGVIGLPPSQRPTPTRPIIGRDGVIRPTPEPGTPTTARPGGRTTGRTGSGFGTEPGTGTRGSAGMPGAMPPGTAGNRPGTTGRPGPGNRPGAGGTAAGGIPLGGVIGGRPPAKRGKQDDDQAQRRRYPNHQRPQLPEGTVPAVIRPVPEPTRHDPGPNVWGIDL